MVQAPPQMLQFPEGMTGFVKFLIIVLTFKAHHIFNMSSYLLREDMTTAKQFLHVYCSESN
jgi:hypothetical protein